MPEIKSVNQPKTPRDPTQRRSITLTMPEIKRPAMPKRPALPSMSRLRSGLMAVAFLLTAVLGGIAGGWLESQRAGVNFGETLQGQKRIVSSQSQLINEIAQNVGPSVVSINVLVTSENSEIPPELERFFDGGSAPRTQAAAGTGIILNDDGVIITNRHVVPEGTDKVSITLSDGTELSQVSVIGRTNPTDPLDIAFLHIDDAEGNVLKPAELGDSSASQVGDYVVAIGNTLGRFQNTVTSGIISGFGRSVQASSDSGPSASGEVESLDNLIQTDAAINQGNSGGPLVNLNGQVIGINTAVAGNGQNVGFAIPINDVKGLIKQVLKNGEVVRPYLGIRYFPLTADVAKQNDLSVMTGAYIIPSENPADPSVLPDTPASRAGLREGDVITKVAGAELNESNSLTSLLGAYEPGQKINLTINREGQTKVLPITLGATPTN